MPNNKRKQKSNQPKQASPAADPDEEESSPAELRVNGVATIICWCLLGYLQGRPSGIIGHILYLPVVVIGGKIAAYLLLFLFGILFAAFVKWIWRLPTSPGMLFIDEANAILFPDSNEARAVARRRACEVDHLVWTCSNLDEGMAHVHKLAGVEPQRGGRHPQFGTHNALLSLGDGSYLEIIAPDPDKKGGTMPEIFGLDDPFNLDRLVAFAVHPNPSVEGTTFEIIAQSLRLAGCKIGGIEMGRRYSPDGLLQWRFTSPLRARLAQPFVIDWGRTRSPAQTAPAGCKLQKLIFACPAEEMKAAAAMHRRIGLVGTGGRVPVVMEQRDGPCCMYAEIITPKGQKVILGESGNKLNQR